MGNSKTRWHHERQSNVLVNNSNSVDCRGVNSIDMTPRGKVKEDIEYRKYILGKYGYFTIELKPNTSVREYGEEKNE